MVPIFSSPFPLRPMESRALETLFLIREAPIIAGLHGRVHLLDLLMIGLKVGAKDLRVDRRQNDSSIEMSSGLLLEA
jgi:hypothetical protein